MAALDATLAVKSVALASSLAMHASPLPSVRAMLRKKSVGDKDPGPFVALAFNCAHWCGYGVFAFRATGDNGKLVLVYGNWLGAALGVYYTHAYALVCDSPARSDRLRFYLRIVALLLCLEALATQTLSGQHATKLLGGMSTALSVSVCLSPLLTVREVFRTKSVASMPAALVCASLACALAWLICGIVLQDGFVLMTNAVNAAVGLVSLSLLLRFHPAMRALRQRWPLTSKAADADYDLDVDLLDTSRGDTQLCELVSHESAAPDAGVECELESA
eukprot:TRINITY_DN38047_c0_g1_i1.p1 TRINITY_DN38047_c0_g1~~TRINITY_DN38047_c0_g1_i1.p1  ORF type:complete len:276 (-),score=59.47 TRINITY_DN38047_c0_g1_i1:100-927(-)